MLDKTLTNIKEQFYNSEVDHLLAVDQLHDVLSEKFSQLLDAYEDVSDDDKNDCYAEAFAKVTNDLKNKKLTFQNLSQSFTELLDDALFDKSMKEQLKNKSSSKENVLLKCKERFLEKSFSIKGITELTDRERDEIFQKAFTSFKNIFTQNIYQKKSLQKFFITRFSDSVNIHFLKEKGNDNLVWLEYVDSLKNLMSFFLLKKEFEILRNGNTEIKIEDIFKDSILDLERKIVDDSFKRKSSLRTFFQNIFYFDCLDFVKKKSTKMISETSAKEESYFDSITLPHNSSLPFIEHDFIQQKKRQIEIAISKLGEACQKLLELAASNESNDSIMKTLKISSKSNLSSKKNNCLNKLKASIPLKGSAKTIMDVLILVNNGEL